MAHGDALIFLTNITWIFVLFLCVYLFFVVYFLPLFYKKFRIRVLVAGVFSVRSTFFLRNVFVSITFCLDFFRGLLTQIFAYISAQLFFFTNVLRGKFMIFSNFMVSDGAGFKATTTRNKVFVETHERTPTHILRFKLEKQL